MRLRDLRSRRRGDGRADARWSIASVGGRDARAAAEPLPRPLVRRPARRATPAREVRVAGWVHRRRDHGGLIFIDLRDRSGLLQLVFHPDSAPAAHAAAHQLRSEAVHQRRRRDRRAATPANVNPELADRRDRA